MGVTKWTNLKKLVFFCCISFFGIINIMSHNLPKLKQELIRRYSLFNNPTEEQINFNYFSLIHDYVDWLYKNEYFSNLLVRKNDI